jgi:hypothetical protein
MWFIGGKWDSRVKGTLQRIWLVLLRDRIWCQLAPDKQEILFQASLTNGKLECEWNWLCANTGDESPHMWLVGECQKNTVAIPEWINSRMPAYVLNSVSVTKSFSLTGAFVFPRTHALRQFSTQLSISTSHKPADILGGTVASTCNLTRQMEQNHAKLSKCAESRHSGHFSVTSP